MKRTYVKPAIRLIGCQPARFLAAGSGSTQSDMNGEPIDDTSEPNPGSREIHEFNGIRWWDDGI